MRIPRWGVCPDFIAKKTFDLSPRFPVSCGNQFDRVVHSWFARSSEDSIRRRLTNVNFMADGRLIFQLIGFLRPT